MKNNNPIGLFDSGIGGTTICTEVIKLLPHENTMFLADQKYAPYGIKTQQEIIDLSIKNVSYLVENNCKLVIVACNTATTNAIEALRSTFEIPIIGIEPAIKPAALQTKTSKIGVLATKGTITSDFFSSKIKLYPEVEIIEQIGYNLVNLIETGQLHSQEIKDLLKEYLTPMVEKGIDTLVLGCTHYPYLTPMIQEIIPNTIRIIDSGEAVAKQTKKLLIEHSILNQQTEEGIHTYYTNINPTILQSFTPLGSIVEQCDF
ncbi:MAG: glutamate racemase [Flavobacteriaceae bacterium]|jgi:glutamate racemase|nr:glutamate racemase [Flavobacteriaceae bacterium]